MRKHICICHLPACTCPGNWSHCKSCNGPITWLKTDADKSLPIDGWLRIQRWVPGLQLHWAICPSVERHRKPAPPKAPAPRETAQQLMLFEPPAVTEIRAIRERLGGVRRV